MDSRVGNVRTKNYQNLIVLQLTIDDVGNPILEKLRRSVYGWEDLRKRVMTSDILVTKTKTKTKSF